MQVLPRLIFGLLALTAIARQFAIQLHLAFSVVNFFSYFTNLSNLFAAAVLIYLAIQRIAHRPPSPSTDQLRAVSVVSMTIVGIVYAVLLRNVDLGSLLPWVDVVLHKIMPCAILLDWVLWPPMRKLGVKHLLFCQIFPALYLPYILIRGAYVGWYPYPFLNPAYAGGHRGVALYSAAIALSFFVTAGALLALGNRLHQRKCSPGNARL